MLRLRRELNLKMCRYLMERLESVGRFLLSQKIAAGRGDSFVPTGGPSSFDELERRKSEILLQGQELLIEAETDTDRKAVKRRHSKGAITRRRPLG